jgi:hypothetical protein
MLNFRMIGDSKKETDEYGREPTSLIGIFFVE